MTIGNFYCNFTTRGPVADDVVRVLVDNRRTAYVTLTVGGKTVVFDRAADALDESEIDAVGGALSRDLGCPALAAVVADDDELWVALYEAGARRVEYSSRGANRGAFAMSRAFGRPWVGPVVWVLLQWPYPIFESWRHGLLAKVLGLPDWCVGTGYEYIEQGELPPGLAAGGLRRADRDP